MYIPLALFVEHDWIDAVNASSTVVIALFTVAMFFVVRYQLRASKDIERAWVMPKLDRDPYGRMLLCESTDTDGKGNITSVDLPPAFVHVRIRQVTTALSPV